MVRRRAGLRRLSSNVSADIYRQAGGHPYLTQRLVTAWLDARTRTKQPSIVELAESLRNRLSHLLHAWWGDDRTDGFMEAERAAYRALLQLHEAAVPDVASHAQLSPNDCRQAVQVLCGALRLAVND